MIYLPPELHDLKDKPVWGVFLLTGGKPKYRIPTLHGRRKACSANDPATLDTFHNLAPYVDNKTAVLVLSLQLANQHTLHGNIGALDLDLYKSDSADCWALVNWSGSYTEWSPSGDGLHVLFYYEKGARLPTDKFKRRGADCVPANGFITMTGNVAKNVPFKVLHIEHSPAPTHHASEPMSMYLQNGNLSPVYVYNRYHGSEDMLRNLLLDSEEYTDPQRGRKLMYAGSSTGVPGTVIKPAKKGDWYVVDDWHSDSPLHGWTRDPFDCLVHLYFEGDRGKATYWVCENFKFIYNTQTGEVLA